MAFSQKPKTAEEYVRLVEQAIVEVDELRASLEYDMEDAGSTLGFLEPLAESLRKLRASMADGSYYFENADLPFMAIANRNRRHIPFVDLLALINDTHRNGLDIGEE